MDQTNEARKMKFHYQLFQVPSEKTRQFGFMGLREMESSGIELKAENYESVYTGMFQNNNDSVLSTLDFLFHKFNIASPVDYAGRSLSVGDIVVIRNDLQMTTEAYFCDSVGWVKVNI